MKATAKVDVDIHLPRVEVINVSYLMKRWTTFTTDETAMSFSHSEGVGMGAVEAALRDKPVIITNYGGAPEYIKTLYTIDCELQELEQDDFLFKRGWFGVIN